VQQLAADSCRWQRLVKHSADVRVYEQIWDHELVNAWLICWSDDQDTGFHDHDLSAAGITVISGQVREERLRLASAPRERVFGAGSTFHVPRAAIHRVRHVGDEPAVTIHAYSPPLRSTGAYRAGEEGELERRSLPLEAELRATASLS